MSAQGREPESPLVIGTWKIWERQRDPSADRYITLQTFDFLVHELLIFLTRLIEMCNKHYMYMTGVL